MKACPYCGKENEDTSTACYQCGTEMPEVALWRKKPTSTAPKLVDVQALSSAFSFDEGFHRVDWNSIQDWIETNVHASEQKDAWSEAARLWGEHLRDDLGADYSVLESRQFILLTDLPEGTARRLLDYAERAAMTIRENLKQIAWGGSTSKGVVLIFSEQDDYYQYVAYFSKEGVQAQSGGMCISSGYSHIVIPWGDELDATTAIAHELTHECLQYLPLPLWLSEGMAVTLEKALASRGANRQTPIMWDELAERHFAFWNEQNIQSFWAGNSFHEPGDSNELSYSLAEVLVKLLAERSDAFLGFLENAHYDDAGQTAALNILGADLGEVAGTFLGEGDWRPRRKALVECWEADRRDSKEPNPKDTTHNVKE